MPVPFTPFPIFAPYEDWKPVGSTDVPENLAVRLRLDEVDPACQAYLSVLYCSHFLEYFFHRWALGRAKELYTQTCRFLEQMLNWSFQTGISLLDWETTDFLQFLEFLCYPPITWCATASNQKYMLSTGQAFRNRPINDRWNIFYRHIDSTGAAKPPSRRDVRRCAKVVNGTPLAPTSRRHRCLRSLPTMVARAMCRMLSINTKKNVLNDWRMRLAFVQMRRSQGSTASSGTCRLQRFADPRTTPTRPTYLSIKPSIIVGAFKGPGRFARGVSRAMDELVSVVPKNRTFRLKSRSEENHWLASVS